MRTLRFKVNAQKIQKSGDFSGIVSGTAGYLKAEFAFSKEWSGMVKVAEFREKWRKIFTSVKIVNNQCIIPQEVLSGIQWTVKVIGKRGDIILTTEECIVTQEV